MSRNLSFDYVIKNVEDRERVDISPLLLKQNNSHIVPQSPDEMSDEYKELSDAHREISLAHSVSGDPLNAEEHRTVALWGQCHDRCQEIINEAADNIWYFFREILRVPHGLNHHGMIPTDMREPDDMHFQMTEWGVKALWVYEHDLCAECVRFNSMQQRILIAGIVTHKLFNAAISWIRNSSIEGYEPLVWLAMLKNAAYVYTEDVASLVWIMINELGHYSFLENIVEAIYDIVDTDNVAWNCTKMHPWMFDVKKSRMEDTSDVAAETKGFVISNYGKVDFKSHLSYTKKTGGLLIFHSADTFNNVLPELTFELIMKDLDAKMAIANHATYFIPASISELLTKRIPLQKEILMSMTHRFSAYAFNRSLPQDVRSNAVESLKRIYVAELGVLADIERENDDLIEYYLKQLQYLQKKASE